MDPESVTDVPSPASLPAQPVFPVKSMPKIKFGYRQGFGKAVMIFVSILAAHSADGWIAQVKRAPRIS